MEDVEDEFNDDRVSAARRRHRGVHHWNQFLIEVIHAVVGKPRATGADLVADLHQPAFTHHDDPAAVTRSGHFKR